MQEILKKLNELVGLLEARLTKLTHEKAANDSLGHSLKVKKEEQDNREKQIQEENEKIRKKKLIADTLDHANAILKEASEKDELLKVELAELEKKKQAYVKDKENQDKEIDRQRQKLTNESKQLEKKKESYKKEVMDEITRNMKGKV